MKAIISTTYDDKYLFFLPITVWCWNKLGVDVICFMPQDIEYSFGNKGYLVGKTLVDNALRCDMRMFKANRNKHATYAQCSRLYAGCLKEIPDNEQLITSDLDMAVFGNELLIQDGHIHVWGTDLVPAGQLPICYISMPKSKWNQVMRCEDHTYQEMLDYHLGSVECENMRGNYWAKDQELAFSHLMPHDIIEHRRTNGQNQFATRRYDRDDSFLLSRLSPDTIDYHMPRPGYEDKNFEQILTVLKYHYPLDNFDWLIDYKNEYLKLL